MENRKTGEFFQFLIFETVQNFKKFAGFFFFLYSKNKEKAFRFFRFFEKGGPTRPEPA